MPEWQESKIAVREEPLGRPATNHFLSVWKKRSVSQYYSWWNARDERCL